METAYFVGFECYGIISSASAPRRIDFHLLCRPDFSLSDSDGLTNQLLSSSSSRFYFGRIYLPPTATADFVGFVSSSVARLSSTPSYIFLRRPTTSFRVLHRLTASATASATASETALLNRQRKPDTGGGPRTDGGDTMKITSFCALQHPTTFVGGQSFLYPTKTADFDEFHGVFSSTSAP